MGIGVTMQDIVLADVATAALIDDRVFPLVYPSNPTFPCVTFRVISAYHEGVISEQVTTTRIQFDVWSWTYLETEAVKATLMSLFNFYSGTVDGQVVIDTRVDLAFDTYEQNIKAHRAVVDVRVTHEGS